MNNIQATSRVRGLTIVEVLVTVACLALLLALLGPALARGAGESGAAVSLNNLKALNAAYAAYAADFNDRQPTAIVDDFSTYGANGLTAVTNYAVIHGDAHPAVILGECQGLGAVECLGPADAREALDAADAGEPADRADR